MHVQEWDFQLTVATLTPIASQELQILTLHDSYVARAYQLTVATLTPITSQELQILTLHDSYVARAYSGGQTPGDLFK
jgi:uncharacterized membrane protein (DUF441 family)